MAEKSNTGYADVNGITMYYEVYGEGKPLVWRNFWRNESQPLSQHLQARVGK